MSAASPYLIQRARCRRGVALGAAAVAVWATGCAQVTPGEGFDVVQSEVSQRTGARVVWDVASPEDEAVRAEVDALLARELTAPAAVQIALLENRDLRALYEDLSIAQADLVQAGLLSNPVFEGKFLIPDGGGPTGVELAAAQSFLELLYVPLRKGRAQAAFEAAKVRVASAVLGHASETRRAYYELLAAEQLRSVQARLAEAAQTGVDLGRRLFAAGAISSIDVAQLEAASTQAALDLAAAEVGVAVLRERLNALMGLWGERTAWRLPPSLPEPPLEMAEGVGEGSTSIAALERLAIERSLDLEVARREMEVAARTLGIDQPEALLADFMVGPEVLREPGEDLWSVGGAIAMRVPIFDQGQAVIARNEAELRRAAERLAATAVRLRARTRAAQAVVSVSLDRVRTYREVVLPLRAQIYEQTSRQREVQEASAFELLQARIGQLQAERDALTALRDYWLARTDLDELLAGRLGDSPLPVPGIGEIEAPRAMDPT